MSHIGKKATPHHTNCKRIRNISKHDPSPPKAQAVKQIASAPKQKSSKKSEKAKINRKLFESRPKRTIVSQYLSEVAHWQKQYREDKYFRFRVISRRYLRKLSLQPSPQNCEERQTRKISWGNQNEILVFDSEKNPATIKLECKFKEALTDNIL